jgi:hypothetical protein
MDVFLISVFKKICIATCNGLLVILSKENAKEIFLTVIL